MWCFPFFSCCFAASNRQTVRRKYNLEEKPCSDCCVHCVSMINKRGQPPLVYCLLKLHAVTAFNPSPILTKHVPPCCTCCCAQWCSPCAICQEYRQLDEPVPQQQMMMMVVTPQAPQASHAPRADTSSSSSSSSEVRLRARCLARSRHASRTR